MLLISLTIFTFTGVVFLAAVNHLGNTGKAFFGLKQVAVGLTILIPASLALGLLVSPRSRPAPVAAKPVFTASEDAWLLRQARARKTLSRQSRTGSSYDPRKIVKRKTDWSMINGKMREIHSQVAIENYNRPFEAENDLLARRLSDMKRADKVLLKRYAIYLDKARHINTRNKGLGLDSIKGYNPPKREYYVAPAPAPRYVSSGKVTTVTTKD